MRENIFLRIQLEECTLEIVNRDLPAGFAPVSMV